MSKRARTLVLGVTLAAMNLAGMTAVAGRGRSVAGGTWLGGLVWPRISQ